MSDLKHLEETIAVFGSDTSRWPVGREVELEDALRSEDGQSLLREAMALDAALDATLDTVRDGPSFDSEALLGSIMSATVDAPADRRDVSRAATQSARRRRSRGGLISAAAMAAALLIGVFAGINGIGAVVTSEGVSLAEGEAAFSSDDALLADLGFSSDLDLGDDV